MKMHDLFKEKRLKHHTVYMSIDLTDLKAYINATCWYSHADAHVPSKKKIRKQSKVGSDAVDPENAQDGDGAQAEKK
jgi:hypothetical protein